MLEANETGRDLPWQVTDAPATNIDGQLRGIVGVEFTVTRVEGKAKFIGDGPSHRSRVK